MKTLVGIGSSLCVLAGSLSGCTGMGSQEERAGIGHLIAESTVTGTDSADMLVGDNIKFESRYRLDSLGGSKGLTIPGPTGAAYMGASVAGAGDVNHDGYDDIAISAYHAGRDDQRQVGDVDSGAVYVVFGRPGGVDKDVDLAKLDGSNGFVVSLPGGHAGWSVAGAGDVNGDGVEDLLIGEAYAGKAYVIFGRSEGFPARLGRPDFHGTHGFMMHEAQDSALGQSVSGAGDVNGDGVDDLIVGAPGAHVNGPALDMREAGKAYVVFGRADFGATLNLRALDGTRGFFVHGAHAGDGLGDAVSSAGDVNGDGLDDVIVGAHAVSAGGRAGAGAGYVVFGRAVAGAGLSVAELDGHSGVALHGAAAGDGCGVSVSAAGDVNGDGLGDVVVGAAWADGQGRVDAGTGYVVFGREAGFDAVINLGDLGGADGFAMLGSRSHGHLGTSVAAAGDINGDGRDDVVVGEPGADSAYVVFGPAGQAAGAGVLDLRHIEDGGGFLLERVAEDAGLAGHAVSGAGDVNGDGYSDMVIGAPHAGEGSADLAGAGAVYVVYGVPGIGGVDDVLYGLGGDDRLYGLAGDDRLEGGAGADLLIGGHGMDVLLGGPGRDVFLDEWGHDVIDGGDDMDLLSFNGRQAGVFVDLEAGTVVDSFATVDTITGVEEVRGGAGDDVLLGDSGRNVLTAAGGADRVEGRGGHDGLLGGAGEDVLVGGTGSDDLIGQEDADVFVFAPKDGSDRIRDWQDGLDRIDLSAHGFDGFEQVARLISQDGSHARIELGGGDAIVVLWSDAAALGPDDFIL